MKFNEKLMELRKKEGLSQEELGYKLNVTRQTVSKWELGQTSPEMDKLVEISKLFNISVDDLINDSELEKKSNSNTDPIIEDQPVVKKQGTRNNKLYVVLVGALIVVIILIIVNGVSSITSSNKEEKSNPNIFERFFGMFDKAFSMQEDMLDKGMSMQEDMLDKGMNMQEELLDKGISMQEDILGNSNDKINKTKFNGTLELYKGSKSGTLVKTLLDEIITSNKKEEREVTVKYGETQTADTEEIKTLKMNIKEDSNFEVSFEYDEEGFINETILERIYTEFEKHSFNRSIEIRTGTRNGSSARGILEDVITSNKTKEKKITIKYGEVETQDEAEIRKIKQGFGNFEDYEVYVEYDADGFINKVIIEKL